MDITNNELKTMKIKQLRRLISEAVKEVMNESTLVTKTTPPGTAAAIAKGEGVQPSDVVAAIKAAKTSGKPVTVAGMAEGEIEEMARIPKGFRLADPELNTSTYTKTISGTPLSAILDYFKENPGADVRSIQSEFNFVRPQIANGLVKGLLDAGILTKLTAGGEVVEPIAPGEEPRMQATEPEDLFMGSAENPLSMYFDNEPNNDGTEDFNDDEEPTIDDLEPADIIPTGGMSDADYEAWMQYDTLKNRLDATKSNITKAKRSKSSGVAGDLSDKATTDVPRLLALKQSLEDRMNDLIASSEYLQKKIEKETGKPFAPITIEPEEDTDTLAETKRMNDEYDLRKLQFYAGIRK